MNHFKNIQFKKHFFILTLVLTFSSCFKTQNNSSGSPINPEKEINLPTSQHNKTVVDFRTFVDVKLSSEIQDAEHVTIKTSDGKILFSGASFALRSQGKVILPYQQSGLVVSIGDGSKQKILPVKNNQIQIGRL